MSRRGYERWHHGFVVEGAVSSDRAMMMVGVVEDVCHVEICGAVCVCVCVRVSL